MIKRNAGILFAHRHAGAACEVLLGKRAGWLKYGAHHWLATGGSCHSNEDVLQTAFRETKEEWCGGIEVEDFFSDALPIGFHRETVRQQVYIINYLLWQFHLFLVLLEKKFDAHRLRLNSEYTEAKWASVTDLPEPHLRSIRLAISHFRLDEL
ncbi:MAG: NUDIX domain-containing protein [Gemmataceae bacterium]|jgi:8-oxo-dGTP pyrophosphatase MutT (NUDIX family)|nr:NUDIX domain-containing protein [Gemmataceae bacterium]